jgi:hypothetical protein
VITSSQHEVPHVEKEPISLVAIGDGTWKSSAALLFVVHLFYHLRAGRSLTEAFRKARSFDDESRLLNCWQAADE